MPQEPQNQKKAERERFRKRFREQTAGYIMAAFGLVAGLAWNNAVLALIDAVFPSQNGSGVLAKFTYAVVITIIVVVVTYQITKLVNKENSK